MGFEPNSILPRPPSGLYSRSGTLNTNPISTKKVKYKPIPISYFEGKIIPKSKLDQLYDNDSTSVSIPTRIFSYSCSGLYHFYSFRVCFPEEDTVSLLSLILFFLSMRSVSSVGIQSTASGNGIPYTVQ